MANETLSLSITNRVSGQAEADKLDSTLVRIGNSAEKAGKQSADFAQKQGQSIAALAAEAAALIGVEKALAAVTAAIGGAAAAYVEHNSATELLANSYRAIRLAASPTIFTASTLAIGLAVEETLRLGYAAATTAEKQALLSATTGRSFDDIQRLAIGSRVAGKESDYFLGIVKSLTDQFKETKSADKATKAIEDLGISMRDAGGEMKTATQLVAEIGTAFDEIENPIEKAKAAVAIFGKEGATAGVGLSKSLQDTIGVVNQFGATLTETEATNLGLFKKSVDSVTGTFSALIAEAKLAGEVVSNAFVKQISPALPKAGFAFEILRNLVIGDARSSRGLDTKDLDKETEELFKNTLRELLPPVPVSGAANVLATGVRGDASALVNAARTNTEKLARTDDGLQSSLSELKAKREKLQKQFEGLAGTPDFDPFKGDIAQQIVNTDARVASLTAQVDARKKGKEAEQQYAAAVKETEAVETRALQFGLTGIQKLEAERVAEVAKIRADNPAGGRTEALVGRVNTAFGTELAQEAKKEAEQLRLQKNQFEADVNQIRGQKDFDLLKFLFGGTTLAEQGEKIRKDLETQRSIVEIGLSAQRENISKDATQSIRIAELQAQPGGEFAAAEKGFQIQKQHAIDLFNLDLQRASIVLEGETKVNAERRQAIDIAKAYKDLSTATADAERDHQIKILELQKERLDKLRESAGGVFDALTSRGATGLGDFVLGQFKVVEKTIFQNAAVELGKNFTGKFTLPGQGTTDNPTTLGRLLANTPLGLDPLKTATSLNTTATASNTAATIALSTALKTVNIGTGGTAAGSLPGIVKDAGGLFNGVSTSGISTFAGLGVVNPDNPQVGPADTLPGVGGPFDPGRGGFSQQPSGISPTPASTASTLSKSVGLSGAAVGVGFGINSAINQGGLRGGLTATGSIAGGASAALFSGLLGASAASGPLAPILAGVALAIPLVTSLLGNPKAEREAAINKELNDSAFREPTALSLDFNQSNAYVDRDARGFIRSSDFSNFPVNARQPARYQYDNQNVDVPGQQGTPFENQQGGAQAQAPNITLHISAIDTKSILDRHADIAEAVRFAVSNGAADSLTAEIRSQTRTQ